MAFHAISHIMFQFGRTLGSCYFDDFEYIILLNLFAGRYAPGCYTLAVSEALPEDLQVCNCFDLFPPFNCESCLCPHNANIKPILFDL